MAAVRTEVLELSYDESGPPDAPPVLLIHGWPDAARVVARRRAGLNRQGWRTIVPGVARAAGRRAFRGHRRPVTDGPCALAQDALDLADALALDRFAVVGHDWGARVAYTWLRSYRARSPHRRARAGLPAARRVPLPDFGQARASGTSG